MRDQNRCGHVVLRKWGSASDRARLPAAVPAIMT
jgi:hypothetical protein